MSVNFAVFAACINLGIRAESANYRNRLEAFSGSAPGRSLYSGASVPGGTELLYLPLMDSRLEISGMTVANRQGCLSYRQKKKADLWRDLPCVLPCQNRGGFDLLPCLISPQAFSIVASFCRNAGESCMAAIFIGLLLIYSPKVIFALISP